MITEQLINPRSIVVVGGSENIQKPGGKVLKNLIDGGYKGKLYVINPKENEVQGIKSYSDPKDLPETDMAIVAIAAKYTPETVDFLAKHKNTKAFIVLSAGFSEESLEGKKLEDKLVENVNKVNGSLIGPNCVGVLTPNYHGVFTEPIPKIHPDGCDLISGSGATACFIMEAGIPKGLTFNQVFSVGNSAQMGVEDILQYMDENFDPEKDSKIKLLYLEKVEKPQLLLKHSTSLIKKGCRIAAIKAGSSAAGSRAASSHTGALASPDAAVDALFRKAGITRCYGREDLIDVATVLTYPKLKGKNIAIITHAGGPAVMLTDKLSSGGLSIPVLDGKAAEELKTKLYPGSSVANPIDFLATGTAEQLGIIIDTIDKEFKDINGIVVIFGTPGLFKVFDVYELLNQKMKSIDKPIFPVLPSVTTAKEEIDDFIKKGNAYFPDEVLLGEALTRVYNTPMPAMTEIKYDEDINKTKVRAIIDNSPNGYLNPEAVGELLDAVMIPRVKEFIATSMKELDIIEKELSYPVVMKVIGPIHKSDVGGVRLDIKDKTDLSVVMNEMMKIKNATGVLIQPMLKGIELFGGVKRERKFGHLILFGLGGIFIEILKDIRTTLAPLGKKEAQYELNKLKGHKIFEGTRGQNPVNQSEFISILTKLSDLVQIAPEISEMDLNPLIASKEKVIAVDARIKIEK